MADIVDTAVAAGTFTTLVAAVTAAKLVDTLKGKVLLRFLRQLTKHSQNCPKVQLKGFSKIYQS